MTTVDARGYSCPEPVIMLRKAMAKNGRGIYGAAR